MFKNIIKVSFVASLIVGVGCKNAEEGKPGSPPTQEAQQPGAVAPPSRSIPAVMAPTVKTSTPYEIKSVLAWTEEGIKEQLFVQLLSQPQTCGELQASWRSKKKTDVNKLQPELKLEVSLQRQLWPSGAREWRAATMKGTINGDFFGVGMPGAVTSRVSLEGDGVASAGVFKGVLLDAVSFKSSQENMNVSVVGPFVAHDCGVRPSQQEKVLLARPPGMTWEVAGLSLPVRGVVIHIEDEKLTWVVSDDPLSCEGSYTGHGPHASISMPTDMHSVHEENATLDGALFGPITGFQVKGLTFSPVDLSAEQPTVSISGSTTVGDYPIRFTGSTTALLCR